MLPATCNLLLFWIPELEPSFLSPVLMLWLRLEHHGCSAAAHAACSSGVLELKGISRLPWNQQVLSTHLHPYPAHLQEALLKAIGFSPVCLGPGTLTQWVQGSPSPAQANVDAFHWNHQLFVTGSGWLGMRDPGTRWC